MKSPISLLILLAATVAFAESPEAIQRVTLDERAVITMLHVEAIPTSGLEKSSDLKPTG